jgi:NADH:ubiquinone oxidoreductase subunit K
MIFFSFLAICALYIFIYLLFSRVNQNIFVLFLVIEVFYFAIISLLLMSGIYLGDLHSYFMVLCLLGIASGDSVIILAVAYLMLKK